MSEGTISTRDEGYTSPDFLTNLFRKPLYSPLSLTTFNSEKSLHEHPTSPNKQNEITSLRSIESVGYQSFKSSHSKMYRASSFMEEEKVNSKKYKLFFKVFLQGRIGEEQFSRMWEQLDQSISNPYAFDRLIEDTKAEREKENISQVQRKNTKIDSQIGTNDKKPRFLSLKPQTHSQQNITYLSPQKSKLKTVQSKAEEKWEDKQQEESRRKLIVSDVAAIKSVVFKGLRDICKK